MRFLYLIPLAAVAIAIAPRPAHAFGNDIRSNTKVSVASLTGRAIPAWARKYNMNCSGCHYPTVPRLNATGIGFKWSGYRMPSEIGQNAEIKKIENYLSVRGVVQYVYTKTEKSEADSNTLFLPSASLFAGGAVGTNYGAFVEFERTPNGAVDLIGQINGVWGYGAWVRRRSGWPRTHDRRRRRRRL